MSWCGVSVTKLNIKADEFSLRRSLFGLSLSLCDDVNDDSDTHLDFLIGSYQSVLSSRIIVRHPTITWPPPEREKQPVYVREPWLSVVYSTWRTNYRHRWPCCPMLAAVVHFNSASYLIWVPKTLVWMGDCVLNINVLIFSIWIMLICVWKLYIWMCWVFQSRQREQRKSCYPFLCLIYSKRRAPVSPLQLCSSRPPDRIRISRLLLWRVDTVEGGFKTLILVSWQSFSFRLANRRRHNREWSTDKTNGELPRLATIQIGG